MATLIRSDVRHRGFALVHEFGHLLDFAGLGLGTAGRYASASGAALVKRWKRAVERSEAVQRLTFLIDDLMIHVPVEEPARRHAARVPLEPEELWARSYAQYVTHLGGDPSLQAALDAARTPNPGRVYYPMQWSDEDFLPIGEAIETFFRRVGWRTARTG